MRKLMYLAAMASLFVGMQSGNFVTFILSSLMAYVLIEASETI